MGKLFKVNDNLFYADDPAVRKNGFIGRTPSPSVLPTYDLAKDRLPLPVWEGREKVIACYDKAWQLAFANLRHAVPGTGFVSDFIDTAFNGYLFMWDSSFIVMFGKYGSRIFDFQKTLDNFYSHQHKDGFICREICETASGEQFTRDDPASTGPNILPWAEWEYYLSTGDKKRLAEVFDPLCAYHRWLMLNRTWQDGGYYSCGLACGMDNQPRQTPGYNSFLSHGHMTWIDICAEQYLSATLLLKMAEELGRTAELDWLADERALLERRINGKMWDDAEGFYFDTRRDGSFSGVKSVAAFWTLISGVAGSERAARLVAHLENEREFKRPNRVPSLSADHPEYRADGGYWKGGVWAPTNYMVLKGLEKYGYYDEAHDIALTCLENAVSVFEKTGTLYENYAPESAEPGNPAKNNFVGWSGLIPISMLFENVFGIQPQADKHRLIWRVRLTERHGIYRYPLGDASVSLICEARESEDEQPQITFTSDSPAELEVIWKDKSVIMQSETAK